MPLVRHIGRRALGALLLAPLLSACVARASVAEKKASAVPTPTIAAAFSSAPEVAASPPPRSSIVFAPTPIGSGDGRAAAPRPNMDDKIVAVPIFSTALDDNWTLTHSWSMTYQTETAVSGEGKITAIGVIPRAEYASLFFTLKPTSTEVFSRSKVLGVSFRLNGGSDSIAKDALVVAITGSNKYRYWVDGDTSVQVEGRVTDGSPLFPETRLYYLGINRSIPPHTWIEVIRWLEGPYDPDYSYVTGFYIKNDAAFLQKFYIDQVSLLLAR